MYSLRILGPAELTAADGVAVHSVLKQPKRTALLAFLATAPSGTRTRAELLELFWPDRDSDEGRHALSQALYYLRRSLGRDAIAVEGEVLGLDPAVIEADVVRFRAAIADGRLEDAVALYRGDLLHGLPVVAALEQWLDGAREALRQQALQALERLSLDAEAAGDHARAVAWAERGHALAPYHEAPVRRLLSSLVAASEPVRAREVFDRFATQLREDLDIEPSPKTAAILNSPPPAHAAPVHALPADQPAAAQAPARPTAAPATSRRWSSRALVAAAVLAVIFFGAFTRIVFSDPGPGSAPTVTAPGSRVGIFPFMYRGHEELAYLGDGIPELISISIHTLDQISTLDPRALATRGDGAAGLAPAEAAARARELGAQHFVVGSVVEAGGQIHVTARLHRAGGDLVTAVSGRVAGEDHLFELVDDLVRQLVASGAFPASSALERAAALTTSSLPALRHFLRGERLFRRGSYRDAVSAFDAAVREDSTFALALYRSSVASLWSNDAEFDAARDKMTRALRYRDRVSPLEGDLFLALHEFLHGRLIPAERLYESVLRRQPENIEAWFQLAETRFHYGALHGRGIGSSAEAWERVIALNPDHHAALVHLSALAALNGSPGLDSLEQHVNPESGAGGTPQVRALRIFSSGSQAEREAFLEALRRLGAGAVASTAAYAARYLRDPGTGARIANVLTEMSRPPAERAAGHLLRAHFALAQGQRENARRELSLARSLDAAQSERHRLLLSTVPSVPVELRSQGGGQVDAALRVDLDGDVGAPVAFDGSVPSGLLLYGRALAYHQAGGEDGALLAAARSLRDSPADSSAAPLLRSLAHGLTAERHLSDGDSAAARADLAAALAAVERWYEHLRVGHLRALARERFLLAEVEIAAGRDDIAEAMLRPFGDNAVAELTYLGPSLVRIGEIRERAGDPVGAAAAYRQALDLWSHADPALQPLRAELNARVTALTD